MAKAHYERTKPHVNIGTLRLYMIDISQVNRQISKTSIRLQKKEKEVSLSLLLTLNTKLLSVTTLMLTVQDMLTTLRT